MNAATDQLYGAVQHGLELVALNHVYGAEPQEGIASFQEKRPADWRKFRDGQGPEPGDASEPGSRRGALGALRPALREAVEAALEGRAPRPPPRRSPWPTPAAPSTPPSGRRRPACATGAARRSVTYSRKVFIPLTNLCRDVCSYCTFARDDGRPARPHDEPGRGARRSPRPAPARLQGGAVHPRRPARGALAALPADACAASATTPPSRYLVAMCRAVLEQTGLLPHPNAGLIGRRELAELREVSPSQGMMLESVAERLCGPGGPHEHAPDKLPRAPGWR